MRNISALLAAIVLSGYAPAALADDQSDVAAVAQAWATAFNDCDGAKSASLYDQEAILWGDYAREMLTSPALITEYFTTKCDETYKRSVTIDEQRIRVYGDAALNTGIYTIDRTFGDRSHSEQERFSFAYRRKSGRWLIVDHHTSPMPELRGPPAPPASQ